MSSHLTVQGLAFEFANGAHLFHNLNFTLNTGVTALVGPNGVGKSSLARLLAGTLEPTVGTIRATGPLTYFPQRLDPPAITVQEFLGADYDWSPAAERLLAEVPREAPCGVLSGGQWMRVRLAAALGDGYLILDEPTNDLDREGRAALLQFLRAHTGGILIISHDREALELCDEVLELSNQGMMKFGGGWRDYVETKERERSGLHRALEVATRERDAAAAERAEKMARQEKRNRHGAAEGARGGMPKILLGARKRRAQVSTGKLDAATLEEAQTKVRDAHEALSRLKLDPVMYAELLGQAIPAQKLVAEARDFNICFEHWLYPQDLNFTWRGPVRIALRGPNGSGKSSLIKALLREPDISTRGQLRPGDLRTLYLDQRCARLDDNKTILENVRETAAVDESEARNGLARFLFVREEVFKKAADLSGGERLRAALACGFLGNQKPELLVLDEPTNNLDLANVEFLENLVREFRGALLVISHDEVFLQNCGITAGLDLTPDAGTGSGE